MQKLAETANAYDIPMLEVVKHLESYMELGKYAEPISGFRDVMSHIEEYAEYDLVSLIRQVISCTGYNIYIQEQDDNDKLENQMEALQNAAAEYQEKNGKEATLAGFLEEAALLADPEQNGTAKNAVSVMTVHKAKVSNLTRCLSRNWQINFSLFPVACIRDRIWKKNDGYSMWLLHALNASCIFLLFVDDLTGRKRTIQITSLNRLCSLMKLTVNT